MIELAPETEALARRLADAEHRSVDETVREALKARQALVRSATEIQIAAEADIAAGRAAIDRFVRLVAMSPVLDPRSPQEIMDDLDPL